MGRKDRDAERRKLDDELRMLGRALTDLREQAGQKIRGRLGRTCAC
jgi:hypothetical protein